jgi:hypothetical protein
MGLLDVLNGMAHGPRGEPQPTAPGGGMSKTTMALFALLAYKAYMSMGAQRAQAPQPAPARYPSSERDEPDDRYGRRTDDR